MTAAEIRCFLLACLALLFAFIPAQAQYRGDFTTIDLTNGGITCRPGASCDASPLSFLGSDGARKTLGATLPSLDRLPALGDRAAWPTLEKIRERRTLLDFVPEQHRAAVVAGTISDTVDLSDALAKARNYVAAGYGKLVLTAGVYPYTVSPNWAIDQAKIACEGDVRFRYNGTGDAVTLDSGAVTGTQAGGNLFIPSGKAGIGFCSPSNPLIVEAGPTAQNGVFMRAIHHSRVAFNVRGAGANSAGLLNLFGVATEIHLTVSNNQGPWYKGARPKYGFIFDARTGDPNDAGSASHIELVRPVIEGLPIGGELRNTLGVRITGGTIEGMSIAGLDILQASTNAVVEHTDFEANNGFDIRDNGLNTSLVGVQALAQALSSRGALTSGVIVGPTSRNLQIERGNINLIQAVSGAQNATVDRVRYNLYGNGGLSDPANAMLISGAFNVASGKTHDALPFRQQLTGLPATATTGSPYRVNNTGRAPVTVIVSGGTISQMFFYGKTGIADAMNPVGAIKLLPGEGVWLAYSVAPTVILSR